MAEWSFEVEGKPEPWQVQTRSSARTLSYQRRVAYQAQVQAAAKRYWVGQLGLAPLTGPVSLRFAFYLPERTGREQEPDLRNLAKAAEDALQGIVIENDRQVVHSEDTKVYKQVKGFAGLTVIWIQEVSDG